MHTHSWCLYWQTKKLQASEILKWDSGITKETYGKSRSHPEVVIFNRENITFFLYFTCENINFWNINVLLYSKFKSVQQYWQQHRSINTETELMISWGSNESSTMTGMPTQWFEYSLTILNLAPQKYFCMHLLQYGSTPKVGNTQLQKRRENMLC